MTDLQQNVVDNFGSPTGFPTKTLSYRHIPMPEKDWYIGITPSGDTLCFDQDEMDMLEDIERPDPVFTSTHDIAFAFPDAKPTVKKLIKEIQEEIIILNKGWDERKTYISKHIQNPLTYKTTLEFAQAWYLDIPLAPLLERQKKLKQILSFWDIKETNYAIDLRTELPKAKSIPISDYIKFNSMGFANCIWHTEKTPSMKLYRRQNRVECFGCHAGGDCIDVVRQLYSLTLLDAVKMILKK